jgi:hypothetical protein
MEHIMKVRSIAAGVAIVGTLATGIALASSGTAHADGKFGTDGRYQTAGHFKSAADGRYNVTEVSYKDQRPRPQDEDAVPAYWRDAGHVTAL